MVIFITISLAVVLHCELAPEVEVPVKKLLTKLIAGAGVNPLNSIAPTSGVAPLVVPAKSKLKLGSVFGKPLAPLSTCVVIAFTGLKKLALVLTKLWKKLPAVA